MPQESACGKFCYKMRIEIGKVLKAQGIKGEVKLECYVDDASMLKAVKQLYIGSKTYTVTHFRADGAFCYVLLDGIADRNAAETLRNWTVYADKESVQVQSDRYFIDDLVGCVVTLDDGRAVGTVKEILQNGAADVFVCDGRNGEVLFPFLKDLVLSVNVDVKQITLDSKRFGEVAVYES